MDATVSVNDTIGRFVGHTGRSNLMDSVASLFSDVIDDIGPERRQVSTSLTTKLTIEKFMGLVDALNITFLKPVIHV